MDFARAALADARTSSWSSIVARCSNELSDCAGMVVVGGRVDLVDGRLGG